MLAAELARSWRSKLIDLWESTKIIRAHLRGHQTVDGIMSECQRLARLATDMASAAHSQDDLGPFGVTDLQRIAHGYEEIIHSFQPGGDDADTIPGCILAIDMIADTIKDLFDQVHRVTIQDDPQG